MSKKILLKDFYLVNGNKNAKITKTNLEIKNDKISKVGNFKINKEYDEIIKGDKRYLFPGFIDMHSHADLMNFTNEGLKVKINQGITTEITGQCGVGPAPIKNDIKNQWLKHMIIRNPFSELPWNNIKEFFSHLNDVGLDSNLSYFLPQGLLRYYIKEDKKESMNQKELEKLKNIIEKSFNEGCAGISFGLCYFPAIYSDYKELKSIFKLADKHNKLISVHLRSEGSNILEALNEIIKLAKGTNCRVNISHLKVIGESNQNKLDKILKKIEKNDFTFDSYPYNFGSTTLEIIIPPKYIQNGNLNLLKNKKIRKEIKEIYKNGENDYDSWDNLPYLLGWDNIYVSGLNNEKKEDIIGLSIKEIGEKWGLNPADAAFDLLIEEKGEVLMQDYYMNENVIRKIIKNKNGSIGTDSLFTKGNYHPRTINTFPKILKKYVFEENIISLVSAINKFTKKSTTKLGIHNRGVIKKNNKADLVIFSKNDLMNDKNNGIDSVMINGKWKLKNNNYNKELKSGVIIK